MTDIDGAASLIVAARRARMQIPPLSGELAPASIDESYLIQDSSMRLLGPLGGWKLAVGADLSCSPIPADVIFPTPHSMPADRPYKIEAEIGIVIGKDLEEQQSAGTIHEAIGSIHPAIEIVLSRFSRQPPREQGLADCQSNEAVILGQPIEGWESFDLASSRMALGIDGAIVAADSGGASVKVMLPAFAWLANQALARGLPLRKGHLVITGARLKALAPSDPCRIAVGVGGNGEAVSLELA